MKATLQKAPDHPHGSGTDEVSLCVQIGEAHLTLDSSDHLLIDGVRRTYGDRTVPRHEARGPRVTCVVRAAGPLSITFDLQDNESVDLAGFIEIAFAGCDCRRLPSVGGGWQELDFPDLGVSILVRGRRLVFRADHQWRPVATALAIALVARLQPGLVIGRPAPLIPPRAR